MCIQCSNVCTGSYKIQTAMFLWSACITTPSSSYAFHLLWYLSLVNVLSLCVCVSLSVSLSAFKMLISWPIFHRTTSENTDIATRAILCTIHVRHIVSKFTTVRNVKWPTVVLEVLNFGAISTQVLRSWETVSVQVKYNQQRIITSSFVIFV